MRTLGASAAPVATLQGEEPINVIGIRWIPSAEISYYADKTITGAQGKILALGSVSNVVDDSWTQTVSDVSVTLSDENGELRALFNEHDIHKVPATIYQTFASVGLDGKFAITPNGQITSPISYDESGRTLSFNITTQIELPEAGFSSEGATIERANDDDYKNWPMAFGDVVYLPAVEVDNNPVGKLTTAFGHVDPLLLLKINIYANRNNLLSAQYAALVAYDSAVLNTVSPALTVLQDYIVQIGNHDSLLRDAQNVLEQIDRVTEAQKKIDSKSDQYKTLERRKDQLADRLNSIGKSINLVIARKETVRDAISGIQYERQLHQQILEKQNEIIDEIFKNNAELNRLYTVKASQEATIRETIVIQNGSKFPQDTLIDILIKDIRYSGTFEKDTYTFTSGPKAKYGRIELDVGGGSADRFVLHEDFNYVDLTGLYCLVYANSPDDTGLLTEGWHIIKVESQQGQVCKFTQVERRVPDPVEQEGYSTGSGISRWSLTGFSETLLSQQNVYPIDDEERRNIIMLEDLHALEMVVDVPDINIESPVSQYIVDGENILYIEEASPIILSDWTTRISTEELQAINAQGLIYNEVGTTVQLFDPADIYYVSNIIESEIVAVHAYRTTPLGPVLFRLPSRFYEVHEAIDLGGLTVTAISLRQRLSTYVGLNWQDQIFVTLRSSVGPETPDIIEWLLTTYTDYTFNDTTTVDWSLYPMHFAVFGRKNTLEFVKELAYQARCGIYVQGTVLSLVYLSSEGTPVGSITNDDIYLESLGLEINDTEALATKIIATWRSDYLEQENRTIVLRHNIAKYGTQEKTIDFYAYTDRDLVEKSATFWLIRCANTWKQVKFSTPLTKLALEPFDTVTLFIQMAVEEINCNALIMQADYNSDSNQIDFVAWLPIKLGSVEAYDLAYPSDVTVGTPFPTEQEIELGYAGSGMTVQGSIGTIVTGAPYTDDRPLDWGREFLSDSEDSTPDSPIVKGNLFAVEDDVPAEPFSDTFYLPPYPDIDTLSEDKERRPVFPLRDAYMGWVLQGGGDSYEVILHTGQVVVATQTQFLAEDPSLTAGTPVYVITGNVPNSYLMYSRPPIHYTKAAVVRSVLEDFLVVSVEDGDDLYVARAFDQWKSNYHDKTLGGWEYKFISKTTRFQRRVSENGDTNHIFEVVRDGGYQPDDRIMIGYVPFGLTSPINGTTNWIDLNVDGKSWMPLPILPVTIDVTTTDDKVRCSVLDTNYKITAKRVNRENGYQYFKDSMGFVVLDATNKTYALIDVYNRARFVTLKLTQDLLWDDSTGKGTWHKYADGVQPGPQADPITFDSPYRIEGNVGDYAHCELQENGTYLVHRIIPAIRTRIRFILTATLASGGNAAATDNEGNVVTVYDELGFEGVSTAVGYADWDFAQKKYYIYQMECP